MFPTAPPDTFTQSAPSEKSYKKATQRWIPLTTLGIGTAAATYLWFSNPAKTGGFPVCTFKLLTGYDCPGCGGIRATHALLHGDILQAIGQNVFAVIFLPLFLYIFFCWFAGYFDKHPKPLKLHPIVTWTLVVLFIAFSILRNIPGTPFWYFHSDLV